MVPCLLFGIWNVGYQHTLATGETLSFIQQFWLGIVVVLPIIVVSYAAGLTVEFIFGIKKGHSLNEGFLVSGMLIPLVVPPTIPLWQVALATVFAVLIGKEVFGMWHLLLGHFCILPILLKYQEMSGHTLGIKHQLMDIPEAHRLQ
jgi:Na+-transporting NADH:ubiquinone oxidoreductase subunit B